MGERGIISNFDRKRPSVKFSYVFCYVVAIGVAISTLYPLLWVFFRFFKGGEGDLLCSADALAAYFSMGELSSGLAILCDSQGFPEHTGHIRRFCRCPAALFERRRLCPRPYAVAVPTRDLHAFSRHFNAALFCLPDPVLSHHLSLGTTGFLWAVCLPAGADSYFFVTFKELF